MTINEKPITLAGMDVGKLVDHCAIVGLQIYPKANKVFIEYARRWKIKTSYMNVVQDVVNLQSKAHYTQIGIETNGPGNVLLENMLLKGLPMKPVTTVGKVTDPRKLSDYTKLSKPHMSKFLLMLKLQHSILWPEHPKNPYISELAAQQRIFKQHITDAGNETFSAPGRQHDDLVLALYVGMRLAQRWIKIVEPNHFVAQLPHEPRDIEEEYDMLYA